MRTNSILFHIIPFIKIRAAADDTLSLFEFGASSIPRAFYSAHAQLNREFDRRDSSLMGVVV